MKDIQLLNKLISIPSYVDDSGFVFISHMDTVFT